MKLEDFLAKNYNYNPDIKDAMQTYIDQWKSWYQGNVRAFHNYYVYNGERKIIKKRFTMNMAKTCCEDWSDIIWSEKCKISMKNTSSQGKFDNLVNSLNIYEVINQILEKAGAMGTCGAVVSAYDLIENEDTLEIDTTNAKMRLDIVDVDWIYPLSWNNKEVTECAFGAEQYKNGIRYVVCSVHKLDEDGNYVIYNHLFRDTTKGLLVEVTDDQGTVAEYKTGSSTKWFSIFRPCLTNNIYSNSPFGISYYANAIDNLKTVDICFDSLQTEVNEGKRRTFVSADVMNYDNGTQKLTFDPNDTTIYRLPKGAVANDLIQDNTSPLRIDNIVSALNTALNVFGNAVGFGENHYHFDGTNLSTATAVISSNSKLFRRKKKLEIGYESSVYDLIMAICYVASKYNIEKIDTDGMVVQFDDSIIEDKEAESIRASREVSQGLISKVEYRMKIFGETKEVAEEAIKQIANEDNEISNLLDEGDTNSSEDEKGKIDDEKNND